MTSGGRRNRNHKPVEGSARSDARGFTLTALPAEGFRGPVPDWPLPVPLERELEVWEWAWRTPQACAWALPSEAWRVQTVARWVRQAVLCESHEAKAADHAQLHRYADQVGLTTAGLREMGWKVAVDEVAAKRSDRPAAAAPVKRERRLRASGDAQ